MIHLCALALLFVTASANPVLKDCAPGGSVVKVSNFVVKPYPPRIPGEIKISLDAEVVSPVDNIDVNVTLVKIMDGANVKIPCLNNLGSCYYEDVCPFLNNLFPPGAECPPVVTQCRCPFKANKLQVRDFTFTVPELPPEIAEVLQGSFELELALHNNGDKKQISCLNVKLAIVAGRLYFHLVHILVPAPTGFSFI